jgi:hypothetical protein
MNLPPEVLDVDFAGVSARINRHAMEALQELFHRIPFGTKITLANGKTATIKPFYEPRANDDRTDHLAGCPSAGIDVAYDDGSGHFEFILYQGGWGGVP